MLLLLILLLLLLSLLLSLLSFISSSIITSTNISGYFLNEKNDKNKKKKINNENKDNNNNNNNENSDVSCILVGITGPFLQRLHSLQVEALIMTDKETLKSSEFNKMNLEKQMQGRTGISIIITINKLIFVILDYYYYYYYCKY